jgi:hypothetical protein
LSLSQIFDDKNRKSRFQSKKVFVTREGEETEVLFSARGKCVFHCGARVACEAREVWKNSMLIRKMRERGRVRGGGRNTDDST